MVIPVDFIQGCREETHEEIIYKTISYRSLFMWFIGLYGLR